MKSPHEIEIPCLTNQDYMTFGQIIATSASPDCGLVREFAPKMPLVNSGLGILGKFAQITSHVKHCLFLFGLGSSGVKSECFPLSHAGLVLHTRQR